MWPLWILAVSLWCFHLLSATKCPLRMFSSILCQWNLCNRRDSFGHRSHPLVYERYEQFRKALSLQLVLNIALPLKSLLFELGKGECERLENAPMRVHKRGIRSALNVHLEQIITTPPVATVDTNSCRSSIAVACRKANASCWTRVKSGRFNNKNYLLLVFCSVARTAALRSDKGKMR